MAGGGSEGVEDEDGSLFWGASISSALAIGGFHFCRVKGLASADSFFGCVVEEFDAELEFTLVGEASNTGAVDVPLP